MQTMYGSSPRPPCAILCNAPDSTRDLPPSSPQHIEIFQRVGMYPMAQSPYSPVVGYEYSQLTMHGLTMPTAPLQPIEPTPTGGSGNRPVLATMPHGPIVSQNDVDSNYKAGTMIPKNDAMIESEQPSYLAGSQRYRVNPPHALGCLVAPAIDTSAEKNISVTVRAVNGTFVCNQCGSSYTRNDALTRHRRRHKGECLYKCELCSAEFNIKRTLNHHAKQCSRRSPHQRGKITAASHPSRPNAGVNQNARAQVKSKAR